MHRIQHGKQQHNHLFAFGRVGEVQLPQITRLDRLGRFASEDIQCAIGAEILEQLRGYLWERLWRQRLRANAAFSADALHKPQCHLHSRVQVVGAATHIHAESVLHELHYLGDQLG